MPASINPIHKAPHFDKVWGRVNATEVTGTLAVPRVESLAGKRVLICSCGSGRDPVRAARSQAEVFAVDVSPIGVAKARGMAEFNGVNVDARVMDPHRLDFPDSFFDVLYGAPILHHLDCNTSRTGPSRGVYVFSKNQPRGWDAVHQCDRDNGNTY